MNYNQYLFASLLKELDKEFSELEYDIQFDVAIAEYEEFENSDYNDVERPEYECIVEYLKDKQLNKLG